MYEVLAVNRMPVTHQLLIFHTRDTIREAVRTPMAVSWYERVVC